MHQVEVHSAPPVVVGRKNDRGFSQGWTDENNSTTILPDDLGMNGGDLGQVLDRFEVDNLLSLLQGGKTMLLWLLTLHHRAL